MDGSLAKRFKREAFPVEGILDLHGITEKSAFDRVCDFIKSSYFSSKRCVLIITGKGLVSNTDYPASGVAGVIKLSNGYATNVSSGGHLYSLIKTYEQYSSADNGMFISKGTLENVLTNRIGNIQTLLDNLDSGNGV